jgi:hypothetical protein
MAFLRHCPHISASHSFPSLRSLPSLPPSFVLPMHGHTVESLEAVLRAVDLSGFPIVTSDAERLLVGFASRVEMEALLRYIKPPTSPSVMANHVSPLKSNNKNSGLEYQ